jgi:pyruvate dehydrogenase E1 component beta subunit
MPISEASFAGVGIGAAINGLRPIVDINIASFSYLAADQIINQAAKLHFMTGGQVRVPAVFRICMYYGVSIAAQHSDRPYSLFMNVPGLKIVCPTNPADVKGLLKAAIRDDDPVLFFEDASLWTTKGWVATDPSIVAPIGKAAIRRQGDDVTLIAIAGAMKAALEASDILAREGVSVELIDLRTLKPLDTDAILQSVAKTGRLVLVENAHRMVSATSEIASHVSECALHRLRGPIIRITAPDTHVAFSPVLEKELFPDTARIVDAIKRLAQG